MIPQIGSALVNCAERGTVDKNGVYGQNIEWNFCPNSSDVHKWRSAGVSDCQFVKDISVVKCQVGNNQISVDDIGNHIGRNFAGT